MTEVSESLPAELAAAALDPSFPDGRFDGRGIVFQRDRQTAAWSLSESSADE